MELHLQVDERMRRKTSEMCLHGDEEESLTLQRCSVSAHSEDLQLSSISTRQQPAA